VKATDPVVFHQTQGAIIALRALREVYESAPQTIAKLKLG
jgi:hypothetical protein